MRKLRGVLTLAYSGVPQRGGDHWLVHKIDNLVLQGKHICFVGMDLL